MADKNENTFCNNSMLVSEGGGSPAPSENDEEKSSSTEYETVTEPSMNEENVEDDVPDDDGHLADHEDSDYEDPYVELNDVVIIPNADADDAQASHQTAHESTQPEYNTDVIIDEDPSADGYLADNEESDEDAPLAQDGVRYQLVISAHVRPGIPAVL